MALALLEAFLIVARSRKAQALMRFSWSHFSRTLALALAISQTAPHGQSLGWAQTQPDSSFGAREEGRRHGTPDGEREGRDRGRSDGERSGRQKGYRQGFDQCLASRRQQAFDQGYATGYPQGSFQGQNEGQSRGTSEGRFQGDADGRRDGDLRADRRAKIDSEVPARERGRFEAEQTDSLAQGAAAGNAAGDLRARETAIKKDFPAGKESYRQGRLAEPIQKELIEDLSTLPEPAPRLLSGELGAQPMASLLARSFAFPDFRYRNERPSQNDPESRRAYSEGYRDGYTQGFQRSYDSEFRSAESLYFSDGRREGCRDADRQDVRLDYDRGYRSGFDVGYRRAFDESYTQAYRTYYELSFGPASSLSYSERYPTHYAKWFEQFRLDTYQARVNELYREGFDREEVAVFQRNYPGYAQQEFNRGVSEETQDFVARPVRAVSFAFREETPDSVFEPGERIDFSFGVRNFSSQDLASSDVRLELEVAGPGALPIRKVDAGRGVVPARGALRIEGALPIRLMEAGLGGVTRVRARVLFRGQVIDSREVEFRVQTRATLEWVEKPSLKEGLPTLLKLRVSNRSTLPISGPIEVALRSDTSLVELRQSSVSMLGLQPGESRELQFDAIARSELESVSFPLAVVLKDGNRKLVLSRDFSNASPVLNDYRVSLLSAPAQVSKAGIVRLEYRLRNVSSRLVFSALELHARIFDVQGVERTDVQWIGFNPQFLMPMERGEQVQFVIPFLIPAGASGVKSGGRVELEVRENGIPVVIHRAAF